MVPLGAYLAQKSLAMLIGTTSCMCAFGFVNVKICYGLRHAIGPLRLVAGSLLMSLLLNAPLFAIEYVGYYPDIIPTPLYSVFIFPSPLLLAPYALILRCVFRFSCSETLLSIEPMLISQYGVMVLFMISTDAWTALLSSQYEWPRMLHIDSAAMLTTNLLTAGFMVLFLVLVRRTRHYMTPPPGQEPRFLRHVAAIVLSSIGNYALLVFTVVFVMSDYHAIIDINRLLIYIAMMGMLCYRFVFSYHNNWLRVVEWQRRETDAYIDSLLRATAEIRGIKHDINNILQVYEGYIGIGDLEGLRKYHRAVMRTMTLADANLALLDALRPRTAIYALLGVKIGQAQGVGVAVRVHEAAPLCDVAMDDLDLCRVLANLLDSAIEAAARSRERIVDVTCERADGVCVRISNSTDDAEDAERRYIADRQAGRQSLGLHCVTETLRRYPRSLLGADRGASMLTLWLRLPSVGA